ncbi:MAG: hypothetical protein O7B35_18615 [Deltaproteobacteria bacterium]|nr:hypothetical protein [Deltaproteobacteria bacterium]
MENKIVSADGHMDLFYLPAETFTSRWFPGRAGRCLDLNEGEGS